MDNRSSVVEYELQEKSCFGESWYKIGTFKTLDDAIVARGDQMKRWYKDLDPEECSCLRIVMRNVVEVIL